MPLNPAYMADLSRDMEEARGKSKQAKEVLDKAKEREHETEMKLYNSLLEADEKSFKRSDGVTFTRVSTAYPKYEDAEALLKWIDETGQEEQLTKREFYKSRLREILLKCLEEQKPLPPGMDFYVKEYVSRKASPTKSTMEKEVA